jgi:Ca2+:H+ antiporter
MSETDGLLDDPSGLGNPEFREDGDVRRWWVAKRLGIEIVRQLTTINLLLAFAPLGFIAGYLKWDAVLVSVFSFLAIIPLSALISDASDTVAGRWGPLIGGLANATFGNTVELIVWHFSQLGL